MIKFQFFFDERRKQIGIFKYEVFENFNFFSTKGENKLGFLNMKYLKISIFYEKKN